eukprot:8652953-Pyramimonas_sp.AAC.1
MRLQLIEGSAVSRCSSSKIDRIDFCFMRDRLPVAAISFRFLILGLEASVCDWWTRGDVLQ